MIAKQSSKIAILAIAGVVVVVILLLLIVGYSVPKPDFDGAIIDYTLQQRMDWKPPSQQVVLVLDLENKGTVTAHNVRVRFDAINIPGQKVAWSSDEKIVGTLAVNEKRRVQLNRTESGLSTDVYGNSINMVVASDEHVKSWSLRPQPVLRELPIIPAADSAPWELEPPFQIPPKHVPNVDSACPKETDRPLDCMDLGKGLVLWLSVDKTSYKPGENVRIGWTLANKGTTNVTVDLGTLVSIKIFVDETEKAIWATPPWDLTGAIVLVPRGIQLTTIKPGETFSREVVWNMTGFTLYCFTPKGEYKGDVLRWGLHCHAYNAGLVSPGEYAVIASGLPSVPSERFSVKFKIEAISP